MARLDDGKVENFEVCLFPNGGASAKDTVYKRENLGFMTDGLMLFTGML